MKENIFFNFILTHKKMYLGWFSWFLTFLSIGIPIIINITKNHWLYFLYMLILIIPIILIWFHYFYCIQIQGRIEYSKGKNNLYFSVEYGDLMNLGENNWRIISIDEDMSWEVNGTIASPKTLHGKILCYLKEEGVNLENYFKNLVNLNNEKINSKLSSGSKNISLDLQHQLIKNNTLNSDKNIIDYERQIIYIPLTKFHDNLAYSSYDKFLKVVVSLLKTIDTKIPSNSDYIFNIPLLSCNDKSRGIELSSFETRKLLKALISTYQFRSKKLKFKIIIYNKKKS